MRSKDGIVAYSIKGRSNIFYKSAITEEFKGYLKEHLHGCDVIIEQEFDFDAFLGGPVEISARRVFALCKV